MQRDLQEGNILEYLQRYYDLSRITLLLKKMIVIMETQQRKPLMLITMKWK